MKHILLRTMPIVICISILWIIKLNALSSGYNSNTSSSIRSFSQTDQYSTQISQLHDSISPETIYYFSSSGSDENDGLSPSNPKKDPTNYIKEGNCQCLLKSGDAFSFNAALTPGSNLVISTYGGHSRAGISFLQTTSDKFKLSDSSNKIYSISLNPTHNDVGWISVNGSKNYKRLLTSDFQNNDEYYVDSTSNTLYIKSSSNLSEKSLRYSCPDNGFYLCGRQNIVIENLEIFAAGKHGISILTSSNILVQNCFLHDIGGAIQSNTGVKYGNGIQIWATNCNDIIIYKNVVTDCFDAGITPQIDSSQKADSSNLFFLNNLIERCNYGFEAFHSSTAYKMDNVVVSNNIFYDTKDITNGYRLTQSDTDYTAYLCLWGYSNNNSSIIIDHNFGFKSQKGAISYARKSDVTPPISFSDNTLITTNDPINYPEQYTGDTSDYIVITQSSSEYTAYQRLAKKLVNSYSTLKILKKY